MNRIHRWYCKSAHWKNAVTRTILPWALEGVELGKSVLEIGPGPGMTTDWLRHRADSIECLEIDPALADALESRFSHTNVTVQRGDATRMPYADHRFTCVLSFTMLHHIRTAALQDQLFREAFRVLQPGCVFAGVDSLSSLLMTLFHIGDTLTLVSPENLAHRLTAAGFTDVQIQKGSDRFRFFARRPKDN